ncbi:phage holin family protein [Cellulomonas cellasea]|uniref:phage holin family protein n=1 Tax=Cellulomonas cellasea TaxID=43670 RepID=UPI0025A4415D|nr:phage holin family protein [Cellulomonas cellasea]MDM8084456.1 phage holin family protein [Cellulomonas cellasea]
MVTGSQRETEDRHSIGRLVSQLSEQGARLVRAEIDLAKAEMAARAKQAGIGIGLLVGAGLFGFFAFATLIATAVLGLATALDAWLAALIVGVALLLITAILGLLGKNRLQAGMPPTPDSAKENLKLDVEAVKGGIRS